MEIDTEENTLYVVVLKDTQVILLTKLEELNVEYGMADCLLIDPYVVHQDKTLSKWIPFVEETNIPIKSDSILTVLTPTEELVKHYLEII